MEENLTFIIFKWEIIYFILANYLIYLSKLKFYSLLKSLISVILLPVSYILLSFNGDKKIEYIEDLFKICAPMTRINRFLLLMDKFRNNEINARLLQIRIVNFHKAGKIGQT